MTKKDHRGLTCELFGLQLLDQLPQRLQPEPNRRGMAKDFSWEASVAGYQRLYRSL